MASGMVGPGGISEAAAEDLEEIAADAEVEVPDGPYDTVESAQALVDALAEDAPELSADAAAVLDAGSDPDGDGFATGTERDITNQVAEANSATVPSLITVIDLDPTNPESVTGVADATTASGFVGNVESLATSLRVSTENQASLLEGEVGGQEFLAESEEAGTYEIDISGVAASMEVSEEEASRAVGLFNGHCARCHTAGYSAGLPFTNEAGSGGFGPALWDGRPLVQFGPEAEEDDLLIQFLVRGSENETPYGLNGFGSGRMPAFGAILSEADISLLAKYLRAGNLDGKG